MRHDSYLQYAIVRGDTVEGLTSELNAALYELREKSPTVEFDGLTARIAYRETVLRPEDIREEYSLKGVNLHCIDCPFFDPMKNKDGSVNRAAKRGSCPFAMYGMTSRDAVACEKMFEMINRGEIRLTI